MFTKIIACGCLILCCVQLQVQTAPGDTKPFRFLLSARYLDDRDLIGRSDPFVEVYIFLPGLSWNLIGRSETIKNQLNPDWEKEFEFEYIEGSGQLIKFEVRDHDVLRKDNAVGNAELWTDDIVHWKLRSANLTNPQNRSYKNGTIFIHELF